MISEIAISKSLHHNCMGYLKSCFFTISKTQTMYHWFSSSCHYIHLDHTTNSFVFKCTSLGLRVMSPSSKLLCGKRDLDHVRLDSQTVTNLQKIRYAEIITVKLYKWSGEKTCDESRKTYCLIFLLEIAK